MQIPPNDFLPTIWQPLSSDNFFRRIRLGVHRYRSQSKTQKKSNPYFIMVSSDIN